jgi:actin-like ATPase involved in cell morphogenesis
VGYALGVDLGTTFTAAAVYRDGRAEIATLGSRTAAVPSVVLVRDAEPILTGEAAVRRASTEPERVAREFKRRLGDTTPIFLAGSPYSAEALMAQMLRWVVDEVSQREGGAPDAVTVTHPANWGAYKRELLENAVRQADLTDARLITEPEAAAIHYSSTERVDAGDVVAVYDLGGGTFDAAVLRKAESGWETLGTPEGIERLGGIDFDAAVFAHVQRSLGGALDALDESDTTAMAAVGRLRQECVDAKEALSADTEASIPVLLPNLQTQVRLTRSEFENMIRPQIASSIEALQRAIRSAGVEAAAVTSVLLVGGSSRIPLVTQLVTAELGRPVNVDAHPKHSIALGAAIAAGHGDRDAAGAAPATAGGRPGQVVIGAGAIAAGVAATSDPASAADPTATLAAQGGSGVVSPGPGEAFGGGTGGGTPPPRGGNGARGSGGGKPSRRVALIIAGVLALGLLIGGGVVLAAGGGDDGSPTTTTEATTTSTTTTTTTQPRQTNTTRATTTTSTSSTTTTAPTTTTTAP